MDNVDGAVLTSCLKCNLCIFWLRYRVTQYWGGRLDTRPRLFILQQTLHWRTVDRYYLIFPTSQPFKLNRTKTEHREAFNKMKVPRIGFFPNVWLELPLPTHWAIKSRVWPSDCSPSLPKGELESNYYEFQNIFLRSIDNRTFNFQFKLIPKH